MGNGKLKHRQRVAKAPVSGQQKNTIKQPPLVVAIRLRFIDCEDHIRPFPKNMEAEIVYGDNALTETHKIIDDQGLLYFPLPRGNATRYKFFRIKFSPGQNNYVICEKAGDEKKTELGGKEKADEKAKDGARFFRMPPKWSFLTSEWAVRLEAKYYDKAEKEKKFLLLEDGKPHGLGTKQEPVVTLLNPHWQYTRFEYFDRYYGHTDHDNKPIGIPAITLEGVFKAKSGDERADTRSNWTVLQDGDQKKSIQCLPWIVQAKPDGSSEPKPDKESIVRFTQPKDTWVISESATSRKIKSVVRPFRENDEDGKNLVPSANRLKYYDLPELWKSKKYWSRFSDDEKEQGFFESMADKKTTKQKPLLFSLDDIILTEWKDNEATPLSVRSSDRVALFYHEFLDPAFGPGQKGTGGRDGAKYLKNGLYKPGPNLADAKAKGLADGKAAEKSKLEKEASEKAITAQKKKEVDEAVEFAEEYAKISGLGYAEIIEEGKEAAAKVETDPAAQDRIKKAGETAAAGVASDPAAQAKIENAGKAGEALADAPKQAKLKAEAKQRAIEEKRVRDPAVASQTTIEENEARRLAEEAATAKKLTPKEVKAAGAKAVAELPQNTEAQARIKKAGDDAVAGLATDVPANDRITKEGAAAEKSSIAFPFSDVARHEDVPNYVTDYPHWSRILVANGNVFDIFEYRTKTGDVIGARAAVRYVDATPDGIGEVPRVRDAPKKDIVPAFDSQQSAYLVVQPYYGQKFMEHNKDCSSNSWKVLDPGFYDEEATPFADDKTHPIGRCDLTLLRSCGFRDVGEEATVFAFHRNHFDFAAEPNELGDTVPSPRRTEHAAPYPHTDQTAREKARPKWIEDFVVDCANRWNGNDGVNSSRAWVEENITENTKFRAQVVSFIQNLEKDRAHYSINVVRDGANLSPDGGGEFDVDDGRDTNGMASDIKFGGAHEYGHAVGQPDDYVPTTDEGQLNFGSWNVPGGPYEIDENAMMKSNHQVRARSFWHVTEWLRTLKPFDGKKFKVLQGGFTYEVPAYGRIKDYPGRNYVHWPIKCQIDHQPSDPLLYDASLYFLGKDDFRQAENNADGIIVLPFRILVEFTDYTDNDWFVKSVFNKLNTKLTNALNTTRVHAQFSLAGIQRETANTFEKCMLHFSPRFAKGSGPEPWHHLFVKLETPTAPGPSQFGTITPDGKKVASRHSEIEIHGKFNDGSVEDNTNLTAKVGTSWQAGRNAKDIPEFKAKFTASGNPKTLEFRFPPVPGTWAELDPVVTRLENHVFKSMCKMLGLSDKSTDPNYYQTADSYKGLVNGCVNTDVNPTMSR